MSNPPMPDVGNMVLYDRMKVPLPNGEYTLHVETNVASPGADLPSIDRHFNVEGPRFSLAPTEVAGVFPPQNGKGEFSGALPQIAFKRRTLPWERTSDTPGAVSADASTPWLALLLFDETTTPEETILRNVAVTDVLPADIAAALSPPADARCDAIEVDRAILDELMPTADELGLLAHVRQVNTNDRELSAEDSDGWFAIVMSNRVPVDGRKYRACLVSLEGRSDVVPAQAPPVAVPTVGPIGVRDIAARVGGAIGSGIEVRPGRFVPVPPKFSQVARLVLLYSWTFECAGVGTFRQLAAHLDVGMIGEVRGEFPKVTETGHVPLEVRDRTGTDQTVWYRGPLVPAPVSRDTRGPYHSADQARRLSVETGMEDVSYAAAFEVGRLLAAADARFAQELMRWRRTDFRQSVLATMNDELRARFATFDPPFAVESVAAHVVASWTDPRVRFVDPYEIDTVATAPGLEPARLADAWGVGEEVARAALNAQLAALAPAVDIPIPTGGPPTLDGVAADTSLLGRLSAARGNAVRSR